MIKESRQMDNQQMKKFVFRKRFHSEAFEGKDYNELHGNSSFKNLEEMVTINPNLNASEINNALRDKEEKLLQMAKEMEEKIESIIRKEEELRTNHHKINSMEQRLSEAEKSLEYYRTEIDKSQANIKTLQEDKQSLLGDTDRLKLCLEEKDHDLEMARRNLQQLTEMLEEKSNKSESQQLEGL
jgi:chromosome segregation ATPase